MPINSNPLVSKTLAEHLHVSEVDLKERKALLEIDEACIKRLANFRPTVSDVVDDIVAEFYRHQVEIPDISGIIGDRDTLNRLTRMMRRYILDLFSGKLDMDYANARLRIGKIHAQIGVSPKLYISSIHALENLLKERLTAVGASPEILDGMHKVILFDLQLVFDTYIQGLLNSVQHHRDQVAAYAETLEQKVLARTEEIEMLSQIDDLTGLLNRREFFARFDRELALSRRRESPLALVFFDLDNLKFINDEKGHLAGDQALHDCANAMSGAARETDLCFRYGGDEFCALLPDTDKAGADAFCSRVALALNPALSVSYGIAVAVPGTPETSDTLIHRADAAMFEFKRAAKAARSA